MASLRQGTPAVGFETVACLVAVGVGEERRELGFQHVGLDRKVQAAAFPQGREALGRSAAPEELLGGRQAPARLSATGIGSIKKVIVIT
jgi:hypothetical protein